MATRRTAPRERAPKRDGDDARFQAWLKNFDTRMADLTARQEALLRDLGVEPQRTESAHESVDGRDTLTTRAWLAYPHSR